MVFLVILTIVAIYSLFSFVDSMVLYRIEEYNEELLEVRAEEDV